jgi:hypothetical protein
VEEWIELRDERRIDVESVEIRHKWIEKVTARRIDGVRIGDARIATLLGGQYPPALGYFCRAIGCGRDIPPEAVEVRGCAGKAAGEGDDGDRFGRAHGQGHQGQTSIGASESALPITF